MSEHKSKSPIVWTFVALVLGGVAAFILLKTAPQTVPEEKIRSAKIVQTLEVTATTKPIVVTAQGTVIPTRQVTVKPELRGLVVRHHPALVTGGHIAAGSEIVGIDRSDYDLALQEQKSALEEAKFALSVEQGRQVVAQREFRLLQKELDDDDVNQSLVLRQPHLERAEAALTKAKNEIAKAELDLTRTSVKAPFNAVVIDESVEIGQLVESGSTICTLAGTDAFWVRVTLPIQDLGWIRLPSANQPGADAKVSLDTGNGAPVIWNGEVERLLSDLETSTRMARVVIRVDDPLGLKNPNSEEKRLPLLIGFFVRVDIDAGVLENVIEIPSSALREGNKIWVVDRDDELQIRDTEVLWRQGETVLVANSVKEEEQLIVSDLRAALPGMKVRPQPAHALDNGDNTSKGIVAPNSDS